MDLLPTVFASEQRERFAPSAGLNSMVVPVRSDPSHLSTRYGAEEEGSRVTRSGIDCWNEHVMRRKYIEATKELKEDWRRREEASVVSGGALDTEGLEEYVQTF